MKGRVHSIESMGLVDGPGIRTVVFLQGCRLRCAYCHNPDTWLLDEGTLMDSDEIVRKILRFRPYFRNGGGVTFSGGEPLLQKEFLLDMLKKCKKEGIHTCIDTAGGAEGDFHEILQNTDLVIYDIKHYDEEKYRKLVSADIKMGMNFLEQVQSMGTPLWLRHVVVPGITDGEEHIRKLARYIKKIKNVQKVELLPFHQLGENKYGSLGIDYRLAGVLPMNKEKLKELESVLYEELGGSNVKSMV